MLLSIRRLFLSVLGLSVSLGVFGSACGARTGIGAGDAGLPQLCQVDLDCATGDA